MKYLPILCLMLCLGACQSTPSESQSMAEQNAVEKDQVQEEEISIDSQWVQLVFDKGGCLTGGQRIKDGRFGGPECVMSRSKDWDAFFKKDQAELHKFLLSNLSDTTTTQIHTCPFFNASVGEVAVYSLQNLHKVNWYDFKEFEEYKMREAISATENEQAWLQAILEDEKKRAILINCWNEKAGS